MKNKKLKERLRVLETVVLDLQGRITKMEEERSRWNWTVPDGYPKPLWDFDPVVCTPPGGEWVPLPGPITIGDPYPPQPGGSTTDAPYTFRTSITSVSKLGIQAEFPGQDPEDVGRPMEEHA